MIELKGDVHMKKVKYKAKLKEDLNATERYHMLSLNKLLNTLEDDFINTWGRLGNLSKDELKRIKTATTHLDKVYKSIVKRISGKTCIALVKETDTKRLLMLPRDSVSFELKKYKEMFEDHAAYMVMLTTAYESRCQKCNGINHETCDIKQAFELMKVPAFDEEATGCKYCDTRGKKGTTEKSA